MTTGYTPLVFNTAFLWLLPRGTPPDGMYNPCYTRPLSGANTDARLFKRSRAVRRAWVRIMEIQTTAMENIIQKTSKR